MLDGEDAVFIQQIGVAERLDEGDGERLAAVPGVVRRIEVDGVKTSRLPLKLGNEGLGFDAEQLDIPSTCHSTTSLRR